MTQISRVTFAPRDLENLFEMQNLRRADHVPNRIGFQIVDAIIDCGEVRRCVIKSAIPLANDERFIGQLRIIAEENDYRAFADLSYTGFEQAFDHAGQPSVVKTFAALEVVMDVEQFVNVLEILHRKRDALVPDVGVFLVAGLQLHQLLATGFADLRIAVRSFVCLLVNAHDLGQRIALKRLLIQQIFPPVNDHPKLCPPVANVIVADDFVPKKRRDARQRVADHGAADMTDMHRLGHVRRSEINHDSPSRFFLCNAQPFISQDFDRLFRHRARTQCEIDKTHAGDHRRFAKITNIEARDDFLREISRIFVPLLCQHESSIGLIIAEARISRLR